MPAHGPVVFGLAGAEQLKAAALGTGRADLGRTVGSRVAAIRGTGRGNVITGRSCGGSGESFGGDGLDFAGFGFGLAALSMRSSFSGSGCSCIGFG
mmetsp:Transcript_38355/g.88738  ORF Transcript_38355/g.88738 Transcript_38355/m.88738 type:complete len:96 (-) Transcript_38355:2132-2419(-)